MDELLRIKKRELTRLEVMQRIKDKRLSQKEAREASYRYAFHQTKFMGC